MARESESSEPQGYLDGMRRLLRDTRDLMDIQRPIDHLKAKLTRLTDYTVSLIVIFSLQTILLPLFMLWMVGRCLPSIPPLVRPPPARRRAPPRLRVRKP
jgi:hypothetical protein